MLSDHQIYIIDAMSIMHRFMGDIQPKLSEILGTQEKVHLVFQDMVRQAICCFEKDVRLFHHSLSSYPRLDGLYELEQLQWDAAFMTWFSPIFKNMTIELWCSYRDKGMFGLWNMPTYYTATLDYVAVIV